MSEQGGDRVVDAVGPDGEPVSARVQHLAAGHVLVAGELLPLLLESEPAADFALVVSLPFLSADALDFLLVGIAVSLCIGTHRPRDECRAKCITRRLVQKRTHSQ